MEDHIRYLPGQGRAELETTEAEQVARWFSERLHFPVRVPTLRDGSLEGARLCFLLGGRIALLFYEVEERPLSLFVLEGGTVDLSGAQFEEHGGKRLCRASRSGYQLVVWEDAGLVYAMVSDLPTATLLRLAGSL